MGIASPAEIIAPAVWLCHVFNLSLRDVELLLAEQARIVRLLVERVDISANGADIRLQTAGLAGLVRDLSALGPDALRAAA
jgi:hypothetical protein